MLQTERLVQLRESKGLSKREMSSILKLEQSTYGKYELGHRQPSLEVLNEIARFFDVSTDYLLGNSESPQALPPPISAEEFLAQQGVTNPALVAALKNFIDLAVKDSEIEVECLQKESDVKQAN